jgi:hypothetical protein
MGWRGPVDCTGGRNRGAKRGSPIREGPVWPESKLTTGTDNRDHEQPPPVFRASIIIGCATCEPSTNQKGSRPLCKFGMEKDVERSDLAIANNDDIQSVVFWCLAFRA